MVTVKLAGNEYRVLEAAALFVAEAEGIDARMRNAEQLILSREQGERMGRLLRDAALMIDNLLIVVEQRDLALASLRSSSPRPHRASQKRFRKGRNQ